VGPAIEEWRETGSAPLVTADEAMIAAARKAKVKVRRI
jgi:hypothetical protein